MAGFLDKVKTTATQAQATAKEKADDFKDKRKADQLLDDLGAVVYLAETARKLADHDERVASLVQQLKDLEAEGHTIAPKA
jgi:polyhydroxyalkanoate synthesis regulator phasin